MAFLTIFLISVGLAMDAMAVSLCISTTGQIAFPRGKVRLAAHFGIFQAGMTALGWLVGATVEPYIQKYDHWIAFFLLAYVGINLIRSGFGHKERAFNQDPSTGKVMVMLSFATSIDAFAVGLGIAIIQCPVLLSVVSIGAVAFLLSMVGLFVGTKLGKMFGKRMEIVGGLILLGIGIRVVVTHLVG